MKHDEKESKNYETWWKREEKTMNNDAQKGERTGKNDDQERKKQSNRMKKRKTTMKNDEQ